MTTQKKHDIEHIKVVMKLSDKILEIVDCDAPRGDIQSMAEALAMGIVEERERMKEALIYARLALADEPEKNRAELDNIQQVLKDIEKGTR